jgi:hypothetical protein
VPGDPGGVSRIGLPRHLYCRDHLDAGYWKAESGAEWEYLRLELLSGIQLFETYRGGSLYDSGLWYVGNGQLALESDAGMSWTYTDGKLAGDSLVLIGEDGHQERYVRAAQ